MKTYNRRLKLRLAILFLVVLAGIVGITAHSVIRERADALSEAKVDSQLALRAMGELWGIMRNAGTSNLAGAAGVIEANTDRFEELYDRREFHRDTESLANSPAVVLVDLRGTTVGQRGRQENVQALREVSREWFTRIRAGDVPAANASFVGFPLYLEEAREWVLPFARGIYDHDGSLKGMLISSMRMASVMSMYEQLHEVKRPLTLAFVSRDGVRLEFNPTALTLNRDLDRFPMGLFTLEPGAFDYQTLVNRAPGRFHYRPLGDNSFALVSYSEARALADWRFHSTLRVTGALLCAIAVAIILVISYKSNRQLQEAHIRSEAQRQRLAGKVDDIRSSLKETTDDLDALMDVVPKNLCNPAKTARGYLAMALEDMGDKTDGALKSLLRRVDTSVGKMEKAISQVHELSQVNRELFTIERCDLSVMAHQAIDHERRSDPVRRISVEIQPSMQVEGNRRLLQMLVDNLVSNAWKFTADRDVAKISVGMSTAGGVPAFFVADNGLGFTPGQEASLFLPFQRLHDREELEGAGLGLATVSRIARRHGGRVWADAAQGGGATFWFTLKVESSAAASVAKPSMLKGATRALHRLVAA